MAAGKRVGGMYVDVACGAEGGRVGLARDGGRGALAHLAKPRAFVAGSEAVGAVHATVAGAAEQRSVGAAVEHGRLGAAEVAELRRRPSYSAHSLLRPFTAARHRTFPFTSFFSRRSFLDCVWFIFYRFGEGGQQESDTW